MPAATNPSSLQVYSQIPDDVVYSTAFPPSTSEGVLDGARGRGSLVAMRQGGTTFLLMSAASGRVELMRFDDTTRDLTPIASVDATNGVGVGYAAMLVPAPDGSALYYGWPDPNAVGPAFLTIWKIDTSNLATWAAGTPTPVLVATLPEGCLAVDIHPNGTRMLSVKSDGTALYDIDLSTGNVTTIGLAAPAIGVLRIQPGAGQFAYLTSTLNGSKHSDITVLDLSAGAAAGSAIGVSTFDAVIPWNVAFHPSGQFAYLFPTGNGAFATSALGLLPTIAGGPSTTITPTGTLPRSMAGYGAVVGSNRLYFLGSGLNYDLVTFNLDAAGMATVDKVFPRESGKALAMVETFLQPLTVKANLPGPVVRLNAGTPANVVTEFVPTGSTHAISAVAALQPAGATPPGPRYTFLNKWIQEPGDCAIGNTFSSLLGTTTLPVGPAGDTYVACFARQWFVSVSGGDSCLLSLNGSAVTGGGGWTTEGADATLAAIPITGFQAPTPATATVNVSGGGQSLSLAACTPVLPAGCPAGSIPPPPGMAGWYSFDETSGGRADSLAGAKVDGAWVNSPVPAAGLVAGALTMSGTAHVRVNSNTEYNMGTGDMSFDAWVRLSTVTGIQTLLDKRASTPTGIRGYLLYVINGRLAFQLADGTATNFALPVAGPLVPANTWTHVAVTVKRAANGGTFYVNGAAAGTFNAALRPLSVDSQQPLLIGRNALDNTGFAGMIDELEIFNRAISADEVGAIFNARAAGKCKIAPVCSELSSHPRLAGWWSFEEASGVVSNDRRGVNDYLLSLGAAPTRTTGQVGRAMQFGNVPLNSGNSLVTSGSAAELDFATSSFTIDAWIKYEAGVAGNRSIVDKFGGPGSGGGYSVFLNNGYLMLVATPVSTAGLNAASWRSSTTRLDTNEWFHIAVVMDRSTNTPAFYVNGQPEPISVTTGSLGAVSLSSSAPLNVGGFNFGNSNTRGLIDELEIFSEALPARSVQLIYRALSLGKCARNDAGCIPPPAQMVSWYPFSPVPGQAFLDDHATTNSALVRVGSPTFPAGPVGTSAQFATTANYLQAAANFPEHNFGTQPFSIDFYLQGGPAANLRTVVEKLEGLAGSTASQGWSVRLSNGRLQFVVSTPPTYTFTTYTSSVNAITAAGSWKHITITSDRIGAPRFYFDGVLDPGVTVSGPAASITGDVSNNIRLTIGAPSTFGTIPLATSNFGVDELELFTRVLHSGEIAALAASKAGKCSQAPGSYTPPADPPVCFPAPAGMTGWYRGEETAGPSLNHLAASTAPMAWSGAVSSIPGKTGKALRFGGNGFSKIEAPTAADYAFATGNFSIDLWLRTQSGGIVIEKRDAFSSWVGYALYLENDGRLGLHLVDDTGNFGYTVSPAGKTISFGQWTHVAATVDRTATGLTARLYIDGALVQTSTHALTGSFASNYKLSIGSGQYAWTGDVDEVELFDRVLTLAEIKGIFDAGAAGKCIGGATFPVVVNTNLNPTQGITVGIPSLPASNTSLNVHNAPAVPAGTQTLTAQPDKKVDSTDPKIQWTFVNWSLNGTPNTAWTNAAAQPVPMAAPGGTYTANFEPWGLVTVVNNGCASVNLTTGYYPQGSVLRATGTPGPGRLVTSILVSYPGNLPSPAPYSNNNDVGPLIPGSTVTFECRSTAVPVVVNTNPPALGATVGIASITGATAVDNYSNPSVPAAPLTVSVTPTTINDSAGTTRWIFREWWVNGAPQTPKLVLPTQPMPTPSGPAMYTASFDTLVQVTTNVTGSCTVSPASGFYPANALLPITVSPATPAPTITILRPGVAAITVANGTAQPPVAGQVINVVCGGAANIPVRVTTMPANIGATVALSGITPGSGSATDTYNSNAVSGATGASVSVSPIQQFNANQTVRWNFNRWTRNGAAIGTNNPQGSSILNVATTFVAEFDTFYKIDVVNNGCATVSPAPGFYPADSTVSIAVTATSGNVVSTIVFGPPTTGGGATPAPISNNSTMPLGSPSILTVTCGPAPVGAVTVTTNPANLGVTVGISGVGSATNSYTASNLAAGPITVTVPAAPVQTAQGLQYGLQNWRQGATVLGNANTQAGAVVAGTTTVYTANYQITGYRVNLVNNGCATAGTTPALPASGFVAAGSQITTVNATPASGGSFTSATVLYTDPGSGSSFTATFNTLPLPNPITVGTLVTITVNCAAAGPTVNVTVNTAPANIGATVGIGSITGVNTAATVLPAGSRQTLVAPATVMVNSNGIGYRFANWTPGPGPTVTLPASGAATYTANYNIACYLVLTTTSPANTGTVTLSPASLAGFPAGCYPMGTAVTATYIPAAGRQLFGWLPHSGGSGQGGAGPYSFTVTGPTILTAATSSFP